MGRRLGAAIHAEKGLKSESVTHACPIQINGYGFKVATRNSLTAATVAVVAASL